MTNKIVAISDPHLGQSGTDTMGQYSLLSTRSTRNLVHEFADAVTRYAGADKVSLVVTGDLLDLSLSFMEDALTDLRALLAALKIDEIIYPIGNHDIKMWELHCEDKNLLASLRLGNVPSSDPSDATSKALYHITPSAGEPFSLLQHLVDQIYGVGKVPIKIAYPSYTIPLPDGGLGYFFHGHLHTKLYTEISDLLQDRLAAFPHDRVAATVNEPMIGLIYWLLGEMGEGLGADGLVERIYTDLQKGDDSQIKGIVERVVAKVVPGGLIARAERALLTSFIMHHIGNVLPSKSGASKDRHADVEKTLSELNGWIHAVSPLKERVLDKAHRTIVVFGHTHTPILDYRFPDTSVSAWNLGTWLVEPGHDSPRTGFLGIDAQGTTAWVDVK